MLSERCSQCGLPIWVCHNEDAGVRFDLVDDVCYAKREIDEEQERLDSQKDYKKPPGQVTTPRPIVDDGSLFNWEFRQAYYQRSAEMQQRIEAASKGIQPNLVG